MTHMSASYLLSVALLKSTVSDPRTLPIVSPGPRDSLRECSQLPTLSQEHTNTLSWHSQCALRGDAQAGDKEGVLLIFKANPCAETDK